MARAKKSPTDKLQFQSCMLSSWVSDSEARGKERISMYGSDPLVSNPHHPSAACAGWHASL